MTEMIGDDAWQDQTLDAAAHWTKAEQESLLELMLDGETEASQPAREHIAARLAADARLMPSSAQPSRIGLGTLEWRALSLWAGYNPKQSTEPLELTAVAEKLGSSLEAAHRTLGSVLAAGFEKLMGAERQAMNQ